MQAAATDFPWTRKILISEIRRRYDFTVKTNLAILALLLCTSCSASQPYRGAHFGDLIAPPAAASAGLAAFSASRVREITGPFNQISCAKCHAVPTIGGAQTDWKDFVMRTDVAGRLAPYQRYTIVHGMIKARNEPAWYYLRRPQPLYGIGLLQAVPVDELTRIAAEEPARHRGRLARLPDGSIGRFGWKADVPTIAQFVATAFAGETGVPHSSDVPAVTRFIERLAPPPRGDSSGTREGRAIFGRIGCADCHRPQLRIGTYAPMPSLNGTEIDPYTDLLLHDMGRLEADVPQGAARPAEFITPPLWGVARIGQPYMHDGRAISLQQAIASHGGQAADSRQMYDSLTPAERSALLHFLQSL